MPLHPQVQPMLDLMAAADIPSFEQLSPAEARTMFESMRTPPEDLPDLAAVVDVEVPSPEGHAIPIRVYRPTDEAPAPVCVYLHGGGWVIGSIDSHDPVCREVAARSGCAVVSVEYRLSPETPFPGALHDCTAVVEWVAAHGGDIGVDGSRLAIAGDSAGGNLAAATCLVARQRGGPPIALQALVYPATDHGYGTASMDENGEGYFLTASAMHWFTDHYLGGDRSLAGDPLASPLRADDHGGLPPALVITAEFDPLRDEGEAYAGKLAAAGVPVTAHRYDGMIHGFVSMYAVLDDGRAALDEIAEAVRSALRA